MTKRARAVLGICSTAVGLSLALTPANAQACEPTMVGTWVTAPAYGQTGGVPRNVQFRVEVVGGAATELAPPRVEFGDGAEDGLEVPINFEVLPGGRGVATPIDLLPAGRLFNVQAQLGSLTVLTTDVIDTTAPAIPSVTGRFETRWHEENMCEPAAYAFGQVLFDVNGTAEPVTYTVHEGDVVIAQDLSPEHFAGGWQLQTTCDPDHPRGIAEGPHEFQVIAVDLAGNVSPPATVRVNAECTFVGPWFGGCAGAGGTTPTVALVVLAALTAARRRRSAQFSR